MKKKKDLQRFVCLDDRDGRRGSSKKDVEICNKMHCFHFFREMFAFTECTTK